MSQSSLRVPDAKSQLALYARYFDGEGLSEESLLQAVDLTYQRTDVFIRDALDVFAEQGVFRPACKAGCAYCCHTLVTATPPEIFYVARYLESTFEGEERDALKAEVRRRDAESRGTDGATRYRNHTPCPFLDPENWNCRLHAARPTACRAMHSGDLPACATAFEARDPNLPAPTMKAFFDNRDATYSGFSAALSQRGLSMRPVELSAALVTIWDGDEVLKRWLSGEDVFHAI